MATRGRGRIETAVVEPDLLLLLSVGMCDEEFELTDGMSLASADLAPTSAEVAEIAPLDVAFAGVGQNITDD